jgi:hypothetical protein
MPKKSNKVDFRQMSSFKCEICGRPIKQNLVDRKPTKKSFLCFHHYRDITEHRMVTASECRRDTSKQSMKRRAMGIPVRAVCVD